MKRKMGNIAFGVCGALMLVACSRSPEARCKKGDGSACAVAGDQVRKRGGKDANATACEFYRSACGFAYFTGCANLGAMLARHECEGEGGEALRVLERACDSDDVTGCNNLGMLFRDGAEGAPRDPVRAVASFRKACPRSATACDNLGATLVRDQKPGALLAKACTGGVEEACTPPPAGP